MHFVALHGQPKIYSINIYIYIYTHNICIYNAPASFGNQILHHCALQGAIKGLDQSRAFGAGIIKAKGPTGSSGTIGTSGNSLQLDDLGTAKRVLHGAAPLSKIKKEIQVNRLASRDGVVPGS